MKKQTPITRDTPISKAIKQHPYVQEVLLAYGLSCVGCALSGDETIEQGAKAHGMQEEEIDQMLEVINELF